MKAVYLDEDGITLWEQVQNESGSKYKTITLLHHTMCELFPNWYNVAGEIQKEYQSVFHWRSIGRPLKSKVQEYKLVKEKTEKLGTSDVLQKNDESRIFSSITCLSESLNNFDLELITDAKYSALIFATNEQSEVSKLWRND